MTYTGIGAEVEEVLQAIEMRPVASFERHNKFVSGPVSDGERTFFLKMVKDKADASVRADLTNEVNWDVYAGPRLCEQGFRVPEVVAVDDQFRWGLFEYIEGAQAEEEDLPHLVGQVATLAANICQIPLGREASDLSSWYRGRLSRFRPGLAEGFLGKKALSGINNLIESNVAPGLIAGIIHGDLNLKNLLLANAVKIGVVDSEFGTTPGKPEWDKPRYHDLAYFYHLLLCQYHDPARAGEFLDKAYHAVAEGPNFDLDNFEYEFNLSLLERTVSMVSHFVINPNPAKMIDDRRRTEPGPYIDTIKESLSVLS